ncbi:MAG TPA: GNAT family N-acetyltransferase [Cellvibrio sp.]|nr:GNAT family N-acetyltransferase [Cellvibrio sp.]
MSKKPEIKVQLLQNAPKYFAQVASWHHQECERQGLQSTLATRQQRLLLHVQDDAIPKTLVLSQGRQLIGCVSLVNYTYRADSSVLIPKNTAPVWLSNLFVIEEKRHQGFGNLLIEAAKKYAAELGAEELWLSAAEYTEYYQKRGWQISRRTRLGGRQVNVMQLQLQSRVPLQMIS